MARLRPEWRNDDLVKYFMRHLVPIAVDFRKDGERKQALFTAFMFSVGDRWILMTAGHSITAVERLRAAGWRLHESTLIDELGAGARYKHAVPFDYDEAEPLMLGRDPTWDYGVLFPHDNTRALLEANGVQPFTERSWESEPGPTMPVAERELRDRAPRHPISWLFFRLP